MTRAVFDANTLVSAFPAASGTLATLVERWRAAQFQLIVSEPIVDEVARAWTKPYWQARFAPSLVERSLTLLRRDADVIPLTVAVSGGAWLMLL